MSASAANKVCSKTEKCQDINTVAINANWQNNVNSHNSNGCNNSDEASKTYENRNNTMHDNGKLPSLIGDCVIRLTHPTCYEPPLYLFPELLPPVPENTAPAMAWDGVADAIDVTKSHWHLANVAELDTNMFDGKGDEKITRSNGKCTSEVSSTRTLEEETPVAPSHKRPRAIESLASLVASNKLLEAGIHASVLHKGNFSASSMIEEIMNVKKRAKLDDDEGAVLMTNHFINLLAWCKLREANHSHHSTEQEHVDAGDSQVYSANELVNKTYLHVKSNNCQQDALVDVNGSDSTHNFLLPSPTPWSDKLLNDSRVAGQFISGCEHNVEERVESLHLVARLFRRPLKSLISRGLQTGYVVPPGTINITSPYIARTHAGTNMLDQYNEQEIDDNKGARQRINVVAVDSKMSTMYVRSIEEGTQLPFVVIISSISNRCNKLSSQTTSTGNDNINFNYDSANSENTSGLDNKEHVYGKTTLYERQTRVVKITEHTTNFGRKEGVQFGVHTHGGPIVIHVGIEEEGKYAMQIAPHHFSLLVRPKNTVKRELLEENESWETLKPIAVKSEKEIDDNDTGENQHELLGSELTLHNRSTESLLHERDNEKETLKMTTTNSNGNELNLHEHSLNSEKGIAASADNANAGKFDTKTVIKREEELYNTSEETLNTESLRQTETINTSHRQQEQQLQEHYNSSHNDANASRNQLNMGVDSSATNDTKCDGNNNNKNEKSFYENKFDLWLVNYARNGVYVNKHEWVLANCKQLERGDDLYIGSSNNEKNEQGNNVHVHIATEEETYNILNIEKRAHEEFNQRKNVFDAKSTPSAAAEVSTIKQEKYSDDDSNDNDCSSYVAGIK